MRKSERSCVFFLVSKQPNDMLLSEEQLGQLFALICFVRYGTDAASRLSCITVCRIGGRVLSAFSGLGESMIPRVLLSPVFTTRVLTPETQSAQVSEIGYECHQ